MDKYVTYAEIRERRVQRSDQHGGFWILSHASDVEAALLDHETYSSQVGGVFLPPIAAPFLGLENDPPEHTPYRRLFAKAVSRPALKAAEPSVRARTEQIVARFAKAGGGDFVAEIGSVLPVEVISMVIGLPQDKATRVRELTEYAWANLADPQCFAPLIEVFTGEVEARRVEFRDDFLGTIANMETLGDRHITDDEINAVIVGLLTAGHETTLNGSANLALQLARDPEIRARVAADPSIIPAVVEESLRFDSPVQNFFRTLTRDVEIDGTVMHKGDRVMLIYGAANWDSQQFPDPATFDPDRDSLKHYSFGWGVHRCVGAPLAQMELRILCAQLAGYDFSVVGEPDYGPPSVGGAFSGMRSLHLAVATN